MSASASPSVLVHAHPNIALVKYWGKQAGPGNQPAVGSLSLTLDSLATETQITLTDEPVSARGDQVQGLSAVATERAQGFIGTMRQLAGQQACAVNLDRALQIQTKNNFPTAAGLASSASGFAALICGLNAMWRWQLSDKQLSILARQGSGSAARSLFAGIVRMHLAPLADGGAYAEPVLDATSWPLRILVAVVDSRAKAVGSTAGMQSTEQTSAYWPAWLSGHARDMEHALSAIAARDFARLAEVTEASCLKMHACMMAALPGLLYWQPTTVALMHEVRALRQRGLAAAFTIDAGPQVKVVCEARDEAAIRSALQSVPGVERWISCGLGQAPRVQTSAR